MFKASRCILLLCWAGTLRSEEAPLWPETGWEERPPESQGLSSSGLTIAADYAQEYGGGSGCIIRCGYLVKEWGSRSALADIKSATKGSVGTTLLGLAADAGLLKLDDRARDHYPALGAEKPENAAAGWLGEITIRQLATMTAGFDDGRPPKLVYRPGYSGIYSNDTSNMLAELITLKFNRDLAAVLKEKVMDSIGVAPSEWAWRDNDFRPKNVGGLPSREFASGITITHRALARIGWLYLQEGRWRDKQIISKEFIRTATRPAALPAPWPYYAFYWGSNARGTFAELPRDAFWALGLGDSFVLACPSLDLVAVRLGRGSTASQLPGGEEWGARVAGFYKHLTAAVLAPPYPPSRAVWRVFWDPPSAILRRAHGSDNWPITWGDDDLLYTAYGDGRGFEPGAPEKLSLGLARIAGTPPDFAGANLPSPALEQKGEGPNGKKASGLLMAGGLLYLWARNAANAQLAWSSDRGATWTWSDWRLTESFGCPAFLNFGKNYEGARDGFIYIYSPDSKGAYEAAGHLVLARVPKGEIRNRAAYEFFQGLAEDGRPLWTKDIARRAAAFTFPGRCYRASASYSAALRRYFLCMALPGEDPRYRGGFGIYDASEPWGPWTTVFYTETWDTGPGETCSLPSKWMSADGKAMHLVFSGEDSFSVRRLTLDLWED